MPAQRSFWQYKLARNQERDATVNELSRGGLDVVRVWEHEEIDDAADRVESAIRVLSRQR